jgi:hypothetical protein
MEREIIVLATQGAHRVVEIGALEGGGSIAIRGAMARGGVLTVVDPYKRGRFGFSSGLVTAKRAARRQPRAQTRWIRLTSIEAASGWEGSIDACVIDAIHRLEGVRADWIAWGRFVRSGGILVARNDVIPNIEASADERGQILHDLAAPDRDDWTVVRSAGTFTAYRRR